MNICRENAMAKDKNESPKMSKPLAWLHGEIKTPPFSMEARQEAGFLLRMLQQGERLGMPHAEPLPIVGPRCGAIRVRDGAHNWRIMYRLDADAVLVVDVYAKKTRTIPDEVVDRCKKRLRDYDALVKKAREKDTGEQTKKRGS